MDEVVEQEEVKKMKPKKVVQHARHACPECGASHIKKLSVEEARIVRKKKVLRMMERMRQRMNDMSEELNKDSIDDSNSTNMIEDVS